jgi:anthraniloyl-CoA monooxygenase
MRIAVIGAGPAGCAAALSLRRRLGDTADIQVYERERRGQRRGFGLVLAPWQLARLVFQGHEWAGDIRAATRSWRRLAVLRDGARVDIDGHALSAISRDRLLKILRDRMAAAGIPIAYQAPVAAGQCPDVDLVIGADGTDSGFRHIAEVRQDPPTGTQFVWYATTAPFPELTFLFRRTPWGVFTAHAYSYNSAEGAFIVEARESTWRAARAAGSVVEACTAAFADDLGGAALTGGSKDPRPFAQVQLSRWAAGGTVLVGDAAHTTHFSIGSGTSLALADAAALADALAEYPSVPAALAAYEDTRRPPVVTAQDLSRRSGLWFATLDDRYDDLDAAGLAASLTARTGLHARVRQVAAGTSP